MGTDREKLFVAKYLEKTAEKIRRGELSAEAFEINRDSRVVPDEGGFIVHELTGRETFKVTVTRVGALRNDY